MAAGTIEAVKERVDIVDVVSEGVRLQKAGKTLKGLCPFHGEKTPSFVVYPEEGRFHCFGCAAHGDVITFVKLRDNVDFRDALRTLAERAGVPMDAGEPEAAVANARLYAVNDAAIAFFRQALVASSAGIEARAYVERRGLDAATVETFEVGYAPDGWDNLKLHLNGRGFDDELLLEAGLLILNEERGSTYDRFRKRLVFPIRDDRGRPVGFGGRALDDTKPKYLNTPQTAVFDKGSLLFALDRAKDAIRAANEAVIVEGYLDAITAHQFGYRNVVASLGTALTERHVALLKRFAPRVTFAMDADAAGLQAALRGEEVARAAATGEGGRSEAVVSWEGLVRVQSRAPVEVRVFTVPSGKDPDDAIREEPGGWPSWVASAAPPFEFRLRLERAAVDPRDPRARLAIADRMLPLLLQVGDPALQATYLGQLAAVAATDEKSLAARLRGLLTKDDGGRRLPDRQRARNEPAASPPPAASASDPLEVFALALLVRHPALREAGEALPPDVFSQSAHRELFDAWLADRHVDAAALPAELRPAFAALLARRLPPLEGADAELALVDVVEQLQRRLLKDQRRLLIAELTELHDGDAAAAAGWVEAALRMLREGGPPPEGLPAAASELAARLRDDESLMRTIHALEWETRTRRAAPWTAAARQIEI